MGNQCFGLSERDTFFINNPTNIDFKYRQKQDDMRLPLFPSIIALYELGAEYESGRNVQKDINLAFDCYLKAAKMGLTSAQVKVGLFVELGRAGNVRNSAEAFKWYLQAAEASQLLENYFHDSKMIF